MSSAALSILWTSIQWVIYKMKMSQSHGEPKFALTGANKSYLLPGTREIPLNGPMLVPARRIESPLEVNNKHESFEGIIVNEIEYIDHWTVIMAAKIIELIEKCKGKHVAETWDAYLEWLEWTHWHWATRITPGETDTGLNRSRQACGTIQWKSGL